MPNTLSSFLSKISVDPKTSILFHKNPATAVNASTLSPAAKAAVLTKNPAAIRDVIANEKGVTPGGLNAAGDTEIVLVIVI